MQRHICEKTSDSIKSDQSEFPTMIGRLDANKETISIPKLSCLTKDKQLFVSLARFSAVTGYKPKATATSEETSSTKKENRLLGFLHTLRQSLPKLNILGNSEKGYTLFSQEVQSQLRENKKALLQSVREYEANIAGMGVARKRSVKSNFKVKIIENMIKRQMLAIQYAKTQQEIGVIAVALEKSEAVLEKRKATYEKDHASFGAKISTERTYREEIKKLAAQLEMDIIAQIQHDIENLMKANKQSINFREMAKFARRIFKEACRSYRFPAIWNIPDEFLSSIEDGERYEMALKLLEADARLDELDGSN